jgi:hypothetical protein
VNTCAPNSMPGPGGCTGRDALCFCGLGAQKTPKGSLDGRHMFYKEVGAACPVSNPRVHLFPDNLVAPFTSSDRDNWMVLVRQLSLLLLKTATNQPT